MAEFDIKARAEYLIHEVKEHIAKNITSESLPVLASISAVDFDNCKWEHIDTALKAIQYDLSNSLDNQNFREGFCAEHGYRFLVENTGQLVQNYNRILGNVRRLFPEFNLVEKDHNPIFGQDAMVSCFLRKCSDQELDVWSEERHDSSFTRGDWVDEDMSDYYLKNSQDSSVDSQGKYLMGSNLFSLSPGLRGLLNFSIYTGFGYVQINAFLREKESLEGSDLFTRFAPNLAIPFYTHRDLVVYRGDGQTLSPATMKTQGFYSTALTVDDGARWTKNGGRFMEIIVPKGTPLLPLILDKRDECEFTLLPGTQLQKESETRFQTGHFVQYKVVGSSKLSELDEAIIFRNAISNFNFTTVLERRKVKKFPATEGSPTPTEVHQFNLDLVNRL